MSFHFVRIDAPRIWIHGRRKLPARAERVDEPARPFSWRSCFSWMQSAVPVFPGPAYIHGA